MILPSAEQRAALDHLFRMAQGDTGQCGRVANLILAWWNARERGGFDLVDLWCLDGPILKDALIAIGYIAYAQCYPDALGYREDVERIISMWRGRRGRRRK